MKVVFMGTPDFSVGTLEALVEAGYEITGVVTQPDKPKGRGKQMMPTPVKEAAEKHGLPVYQPRRVRDAEAIEEIRKMEPDVIVVVAFGQIIPKEILDMPKYGCINVHASLLPAYRGAAPIQWCVINGEEKTMKMIQALSKYLRLSLSKGREIVTVEDELENVKSYMEIQQIRNENLFRYEIECGEELKTRWILKLILQPIVENAVKYGFCDIFEGGLIRISVTEQAGQLTFSVYNNGTPMEEQMAEKLNGLSEIPVSKMKDSFEDKKHGYGVINIITRLRLKYGEDVRFFYESDTNGTVCVIQIPDDGKENSEQ